MVIYRQNQNSTWEESLTNYEKNVNLHQIEISKISTSSNTHYLSYVWNPQRDMKLAEVGYLSPVQCSQ